MKNENLDIAIFISPIGCISFLKRNIDEQSVLCSNQQGNATVQLPTSLKQVKMMEHLPTNRSKWRSSQVDLSSKPVAGLSVQEVSVLQNMQVHFIQILYSYK